MSQVFEWVENFKLRRAEMPISGIPYSAANLPVELKSNDKRFEESRRIFCMGKFLGCGSWRGVTF